MGYIDVNGWLVVREETVRNKNTWLGFLFRECAGARGKRVGGGAVGRMGRKGKLTKIHDEQTTSKQCQ